MAAALPLRALLREAHLGATGGLSMRTETEALGRAALEDCLGSVGGELEREVLCSCNALFFEGGFVALVRLDDCERHRLRGAAELNDDVDQRLGRFWIRAITDDLRVDLHRLR